MNKEWPKEWFLFTEEEVSKHKFIEDSINEEENRELFKNMHPVLKTIVEKLTYDNVNNNTLCEIEDVLDDIRCMKSNPRADCMDEHAYRGLQDKYIGKTK